MTPELIRKERARLGVSQAGLARMLGVSSYITVWRWETGQRACPLATWLLIRFASALPADRRPIDDVELDEALQESASKLGSE